MSAKLIAEEGVLEGLVLSFDDGDEWVIGRDPDESQMLIADPEASKQHLRARRTKENQIQIENLSEENPVQVNDQELREPQLLHHGDALKIGGSRFRFYTEIGPEIQGLNGQDETHPVPMESQKEEQIDSPEHENQNEATEQQEQEEESSPLEDDELLDPKDRDNDELLANVDFGLDETGPFMLKVIRGPNSGAEFSMEPGRSYVLGTASNDCEVVFHDISVSRQHAKLTIESDNQLFIEDLGSRNGTLVDDKKIKERTPLAQNIVVTVGTTSFIVFDRESERHTVITPFLPSIVKSLQQDEAKKNEKKKVSKAPKPSAELTKPLPPPRPKTNYFTRTLLILGIVTLFIAFGMGTSTLFRSQTILAPEVDTSAEIEKALTKNPGLQYSFNKESGRLLLIGHVLTAVDRSQQLYQLQTLPFIKSIDEKNLIIDEYIWKETNQILNKNPSWTGISLHSPTAGRFILNGYLKTRKQSDQLNDFLAQNFRYLDRLDNRVIVEEAELNAIGALLAEKGLRDVTVELHNGEVTLSGTMPARDAGALDKAIALIKKRPTVRLLKDYVTQLEPEQSVINLTDNYTVSGSSNVGGITVSVVINGRILTKGDQLDGLTITEINPHTILLERDKIKYKIEYNN